MLEIVPDVAEDGSDDPRQLRSEPTVADPTGRTGAGPERGPRSAGSGPTNPIAGDRR